MRPRLRLSPVTQQLHHGFRLPRLHTPPSPSGSALASRTPTSTSEVPPPPLHSSGFPSSIWLHLSPLSLQFRRGLPDLHLHIGRQSYLLCFSPPDPRIHPSSSALHLRLGLHHLLHRPRLAHWSHQSFIQHASSLRRLHHGPPSWLGPGPAWLLQVPPICSLAPSSVWSALAPPGSSLHQVHPGSSCLLPGSQSPCLPSCKPFVVPPSPSLLHYLCMSPSVPPFVSTAQDRTFWEGRGRGQSVTPHWTFVVFCLSVFPWLVSSCVPLFL